MGLESHIKQVIGEELWRRSLIGYIRGKPQLRFTFVGDRNVAYNKLSRCGGFQPIKIGKLVIRFDIFRN